MIIRAYLRASTKEQDAKRAKQGLVDFVARFKGRRIAAFYYENKSGADLDRPVLQEIIDLSERGDVILVEQVDRLTRLSESDWNKLRTQLKEKGIVVVSPELEFSWAALEVQPEPAEGEKEDISSAFQRMFVSKFGEIMFEMLAITARKDYLDRIRRSREGIDKVLSNPKLRKEKYPGRARDEVKRKGIRQMLNAGNTYSEIQQLLNCSRRLIADVSREIKDEKEALLD